MLRLKRLLLSADGGGPPPDTHGHTLRIAGLSTADPNRMSFVHSALATRTVGSTTYQVCAYRSFRAKLVLGWRIYPSGAWTLYHYDGRDRTDLGTFALNSHNTAVVQIDGRGYVHFAWDHHNAALKYRRSAEPLGAWTGGVTSALSMLGTNESSVTYPMFFRDPATGALYFMFRAGVTGHGDWMFYRYAENIRSWAAAPGSGPGGVLIKGAIGQGDSPYLNGIPKFSGDWTGSGAGRSMHMNWMWRESASGPPANRDLCHACWNGTSWTRIDGTPQVMPITKRNCQVVYPIGPSVDLFNQCDLDLDSGDRPLVAAIHNDRDGISQLYAVYYDGSAWRSSQITHYVRGTWEAFTRVAVLVDRDANTAFLLGTNLSEPDAANTAYQWTSAPGDFSRWEKTRFHTETGYGCYEHTYDRDLWTSRRELAMVFSVSAADGTRVPVKLMSSKLKRESVS